MYSTLYCVLNLYCVQFSLYTLNCIVWAGYVGAVEIDRIGTERGHGAATVSDKFLLEDLTSYAPGRL